MPLVSIFHDLTRIRLMQSNDINSAIEWRYIHSKIRNLIAKVDTQELGASV